MDRIWSYNQTIDYLSDLSEEELRQELADMYGEDMVSGMSKEEMEDLVNKDYEYFFEDEVEDFQSNILPQITGQSRNDLIILVDDRSFANGQVVSAEDLVTDNPLIKDDASLWSDNGNLVFKSDGIYYDAYAIPEDDADEFITECLSTWCEDLMDYYNGNSDIYGNDYSEEDAIYDVSMDLDDAYKIDQYIEYSEVPRYCEPIKVDSFTESLDEAKRKQTAGTKNVSQLEMELAQLENIYENNGPNSFYDMSFDEFSRRWPEFTNSILISFLESMVDYHIDDESEDDTEEYWRSGDLVTSRDWPALIKGAHKIIDDGWNNFGWIAVWKDFYTKDDKGDDIFEAATTCYKLCMELFPEDISKAKFAAQEYGLKFIKSNEEVPAGPNQGALYCYVKGDKPTLEQFAQLEMMYEPEELEEVIIKD